MSGGAPLYPRRDTVQWRAASEGGVQSEAAVVLVARFQCEPDVLADWTARWELASGIGGDCASGFEYSGGVYGVS